LNAVSVKPEVPGTIELHDSVAVPSAAIVGVVAASVVVPLVVAVMPSDLMESLLLLGCSNSNESKIHQACSETTFCLSDGYMLLCGFQCHK
jgi:hypothetical protein